MTWQVRGISASALAAQAKGKLLRFAIESRGDAKSGVSRVRPGFNDRYGEIAAMTISPRRECETMLR